MNITLRAGEGGLVYAVMYHPSGAEARVCLRGAHVTYWRTAAGDEPLYMSPQAIHFPDKALRGGIPVCWPQFSDIGSLSAHGFARTSAEWVVKSSSSDAECTTLTLRLADTESTRRLWPFKFFFDYVIRLGRTSLGIEMLVTNRDDKEMEFTTALHTYYRVRDISKAMVTNLSGLTYLDDLDHRSEKKETAPEVTFDREVDRIYVSTPEKVNVVDGTTGVAVEITKSATLPDAVAWNPWIEKSKKMADFPDDDYRRMLCVEAGAICGKARVAPGATWRATMDLRVISSRL